MLISPRTAALIALAIPAIALLATSCDIAPPPSPPSPTTAAAPLPLSAWHLPGQMLFARKNHTATLLPSGKVLIVGGREDREAELYDPATGTFAATRGQMSSIRIGHSATLLPSGRVLIVGGDIFDLDFDDDQEPSDAGPPDAGPPNAEYSDAGPPDAGHAGTPRAFHGSAEIYDPEQDTFTAAGVLHTPRRHHTANLLPDGTVLVAGGDNSFTASASNKPDAGFPTSKAEIYRPPATGGSASEGTFEEVGPMTMPRSEHTATLLRSGEILITGGIVLPNHEEALPAAEIYDVQRRTFSLIDAHMTIARAGHTAVLLPPQADGGEEVLLVGSTLPAGKLHRFAEVYRTKDKTFAPLALDEPKYLEGLEVRPHATATMLPSGQVLFAGLSSAHAGEALIFNPSPYAFRPTPALQCHQQAGSTATLLPSGKVLLLGGDDGSAHPSSCAELYGEDTSLSVPVTASMHDRRTGHTATLLPDGSVLFVGGLAGPATPSTTDATADNAAEIFKPGSLPEGGSFEQLPAHMRNGHTATLLSGGLAGRVLIAGGQTEDDQENSGQRYLDTVEIFDAATGTFSAIKKDGSGEMPLAKARAEHTATLLPIRSGIFNSGEILIAGGYDGKVVLSSAELWNPEERTSRIVQSAMTTPRQNHTATLLLSGKVLLAGGKAEGIGPLLSAEIYDPFSETFSATSAMQRPHARGAGDRFTATLLPSGKVLIVGLGTAELFDPDGDDGRGAFTLCGTSSRSVTNHTATLLPSGLVMIAGGTPAGGPLDDAVEIVDPATCTFTPMTAPCLQGRAGHTATLLPSGQVLLAGGLPSASASDTNVSCTDSVIWYPMKSAATSAAPRLNAIPPKGDSDSVTITGTGLLGASEASSSATSASASHFPVGIWMSLAGGAVTGTLTDWSDDAARWTIPRSRLFGAGLFFVVSNGVASNGQPFELERKLYCSSHLDCPGSYVCRASGECGPPLGVATAPAGCGLASASDAPTRPGPLAIAAALLLVAAGARRRARGLRSSRPLGATTRGRCRAG